ncbi:MAG: TrmH family RNA methyltransferase [Bdellovibrionales bacterium]|nr:TrmH family RNA methyltransferase [Bdellovibrionales bacterium]
MIESAQNANFKRWRSLLDSKGVKKEGQALVSGEKVVNELSKSHKDSVIEVLLSSCLHIGYHTTFKASFLEHQLYQELDIFGTGSPLLVLKTPQIEDWKPELDVNGLELLLPFGDPSNLGAALRNAAAFSVSKVVLLKEASHAFLPKVSRAASGMNWQTPLCNGPSIRELGATSGLIAFDLEGEDLVEFKWPENSRLLIGDEGPGVPDSIEPAFRVKIPMSKRVESLNAVAASSIALFHYRSQFKA